MKGLYLKVGEAVGRWAGHQAESTAIPLRVTCRLVGEQSSYHTFGPKHRV